MKPAKFTARQHHEIKAIVAALNRPRDHSGRLTYLGDTGCRSLSDLTRIAVSYPQIPHGGFDTIDKAVMILQCLLGEKPTSILDR